MALTLIIIYLVFMAFIMGYSIIQSNLIYHYLRAHSKKKLAHVPGELEFQPMVTIQLPIYNELYVVEALLEECANIDYPSNRLEIQVLDDSTDETVELIANKVKELQARGVDIQHVRRTDRKGYKAGALKHGLAFAKGEFIAIFDADFLPEPNFLNRTIETFKDEKVGMVQTRWEHINRDYSRLTKSQAFGLDAHFTIEQTGRNHAGLFINFNGTSGIWRKKCIMDAGNWQSDTITEDMDLSFRAQLKGWKFKYLEGVASPSELPVTIDAFKSQQYRWNKGSAETTKKILGKVYRAKHVTLKEKIHSTFHLLGNFNFICVIVTAVISVPLLIIKATHPEYKLFFQLASVFVFGFFVLGVFYWFSNKKEGLHKEINPVEFLVDFITFLSISMGMSLHNSLAFISGMLGFKSAFIRTPKFNLLKGTTNWEKNKYVRLKLKPIVILEGVMIIYFGFALYEAYRLKDYGLVPFHLMLFSGFTYVFYLSIAQSFKVAFIAINKSKSYLRSLFWFW